MRRAPRVVLPFTAIQERRISTHISSLNQSLHDFAAIVPRGETTTKQQQEIA